MRWMDYAVKPGSKPIAMRPSLQQCVRRIRISIAGILVRWSTRLGVFAAWVSPTKSWGLVGLPRRHWLLSAVVVLILLGYVVPFATDYLDDSADSNQKECEKEGHSEHPQQISRPAHPGGILKIRLTNNGEFVDRCELSDIRHELNWNTPGADRAPSKPGARSLPKFVVLWIHGWKHRGEDDAYNNFKKLIHKLADDPANADKKQVLGVYVDWNATSKVPPFNWFPFDNLTFWTRQAIANRIAQSAVTTKIISSINSVLSEGENSAANQFITIGHSFGAGMLFSATKQSFIYDHDEAHPPSRQEDDRPISGIVNMVILLNPAFKAARYTVLDALVRPKERFHKDQLPLLLSVSSDVDWATKYLFPPAQMLSHYRWGPEVTTLGNYTDYQTHSLLEEDSGACGSSSPKHLSESFLANHLCLVRDNERGMPLSPFLIARTSAPIINGHSDIWNEKFIGWLFDYVNELGKQHRPRSLDKEGQETQDVSSTAEPVISVPSMPASLETAAKP